MLVFQFRDLHNRAGDKLYTLIRDTYVCMHLVLSLLIQVYQQYRMLIIIIIISVSTQP